MPINPFSVSNVCLLGISAGLLLYLFILAKHVNERAKSSMHVVFKTPVQMFACVYAVYLFLISVLAANHFFKAVTTPPRFLFIFLPLIGFVTVTARASLNSTLSFLRVLPPFLLIVVHVYRLFIELAFVQFANEGIIPAVLSIHGRNYDLLIGAMAIPVALLFWNRHPLARRAGIAYNILGLLSLLNIFTIVIPSLPTSFQRYKTFLLPLYFPGILIVFLASMAIFLHILSLRQLLSIKVEVFPAESKVLPLEKGLSA